MYNIEDLDNHHCILHHYFRSHNSNFYPLTAKMLCLWAYYEGITVSSCHHPSLSSVPRAQVSRVSGPDVEILLRRDTQLCSDARPAGIRVP